MPTIYYPGREDYKSRPTPYDPNRYVTEREANEAIVKRYGVLSPYEGMFKDMLPGYEPDVHVKFTRLPPDIHGETVGNRIKLDSYKEDANIPATFLHELMHIKYPNKMRGKKSVTDELHFPGVPEYGFTDEEQIPTPGGDTSHNAMVKQYFDARHALEIGDAIHPSLYERFPSLYDVQPISPYLGAAVDFRQFRPSR